MQEQPLGRRTVLRGLAAGAAVLVASDARAVGPPPPRRREISREPLNLEFPFDRLDTFRTPTDLHYVRNHYPIPRLDARTWRLRVEGAVRRPLTLTLAEVRKLPSVTMPITLECAGNGRALLVPASKGTPWRLGGVSTADWTGVPLAAVLDLAGVQPGAVEVILDSADRGDPKKEGQPPGLLSFARSLSLAKARRPETLLAWGMNGADLPPEHGFPLRAVVGGWYGMASVKWLTRIVVTTRPFLGFDQTIDYAVWEQRDGLPALTAITAMDVKASISQPVAGDLNVGREVRIHGAAWAGESDVAGVQISTDGGKIWSAATLLGRPVPFCWRLWEMRWTPRAAGRTELMARATDRAGRTQPLTRDPARRSYMITHVIRTPVEVRA